MQAASNRFEIVKIALDGFKTPIFESLDQVIFTLRNDHPFFIQHDHIHVQPFAAGVHGMAVWHIRLRTHQDIPATLFENLGDFLIRSGLMSNFPGARG
jgi:hypothetical protein